MQVGRLRLDLVIVKSKTLLLSPGEERSVRHLLGAGGPQRLTAFPGSASMEKRGRTRHPEKELLREEDLRRQGKYMTFFGQPDLCSDLHLQLGMVWPYDTRTHRAVHESLGK